MTYMNLIDVCDFQGGSQPPKDKWITQYKDGYIRMLQIRDFTQKRDERDYVEVSNRIKICKKDDVLIARYGASVGKILTGLEGAYNVAIIKSIPSKLIDKRYLYYYFNSSYFQNFLKNVGSRAAQAGFNKEDLREAKIFVPKIEHQRNIVSILNKSKNLIERRKNQIEQLDLLVKSKFIEMFGSENSIFEKWETVNIGAVSEVGVGVVIKPADYYTDKENGIKTFRSLNVGEMKVKDENWVYFSKEGNEKNKKSILKKGQILIVRSGYPGTACVVTEEYEGCNAIDVIIATPNNKKINSVYMCAFTNYRHGKNQILEGQAGAAQKHFNVGAYKNMKIALPPLEEQEKFELFLKQVDKLKFEMEKSLKELEDNFNSLMNKAFKGELF
ncbi:TPA: restriction endonuclease subunit S [Clostridium perfringens]